MGIYRCNQCGTVAEHPYQQGMGQIACVRCQHPVSVYDTVFFVQKLLERYLATARELKALQESEAEESNSEAPENTALLNVDIHNTSMLATPEQHFPLASWFSSKNIKPVFDYAAVDMSGYFDEAAQALANPYADHKDLLGRINWAYRNKHAGLNIDLSKMPQKAAQSLNKLCREFYSHSLFGSYFYQKQDKIIRLKLQKASAIERFFNGAWLEWWALGSLLNEMKKCESHTFSCARGVKIEFGNADVHELDVVWLTKGKQPVVVECKSGEFRRDIDKYIRLKQRLDLPAAQFIVLAIDLEDNQCNALSSMYDITFVNLNNFLPYIQKLI